MGTSLFERTVEWYHHPSEKKGSGRKVTDTSGTLRGSEKRRGTTNNLGKGMVGLYLSLRVTRREIQGETKNCGLPVEGGIQVVYT